MTKRNEHERQSASIPAGANLDTWSAESWTNGIQVDELLELETLSIETMNHTYEVTIINPTTGEALVRGGEFLPERTIAYISGASLGGSFLKLRGIYIGFKLELLTGGRRIVTSTVRRISLLSEQKEFGICGADGDS